MSLILGFDTSGPYCAATVLEEGEVLAARHEDMAKGQAERLMSLLEDVLTEAGKDWRDLHRLGVGVGPGNFTGIRISVSAARGLSLSLGIPAIGVTLFEALSVEAKLPILASLQAPRGEVYLQEIHASGASGASDPVQMSIDHIAPLEDPGFTCVGHRSDEIATHLGLPNAQAAYAPASAIARAAAVAPVIDGQRPSPFYLRPADAAPPRDPAPVIL